jgi:inorganic triphosphatase YgiF
MPQDEFITDPPSEIELKLFLPLGADAQLPLVPLLRNVRPRRLRLDSTYFDTPDRLLQRHGMALRLRRVGRRWMQTLKAMDVARGGLSTRPEWETPAKLVDGRPRFDFRRLAATPLPALLAKHRAQRKLRPLFRVRVQRTLWDLVFRQSRIEVAIDRGRIESVTDRRAVAPVAELELELKSGNAEDLNAAALRLIGRGRAALALVPMVRGKAERGYLLVSGKPAPATKASAGGFVAALRPDMTAGEALRAIASHGLTVLLANTEALHDSHDPEYVHQARVALRRVRSALRLLDREHEDFPESLAADLRWVARLLGNARDWDVLVTETLPRLLKDTPPELASQITATLERIHARRQSARAEVAAALATAKFAQLALRLQAWTMTPARRGRTLKRLASDALDKAHRRLFDAARFFIALSPEQRHRVRILAKRLRYALDVLSVALPKDVTERYVAALSELQDVLGELNDNVVAQGVLVEIDAPDTVIDFARRKFEHLTKEKLTDAELRLFNLYSTERHW